MVGGVPPLVPPAGSAHLVVVSRAECGGLLLPEGTELYGEDGRHFNLRHFQAAETEGDERNVKPSCYRAAETLRNRRCLGCGLPVESPDRITLPTEESPRGRWIRPETWISSSGFDGRFSPLLGGWVHNWPGCVRLAIEKLPDAEGEVD